MQFGQKKNELKGVDKEDGVVKEISAMSAKKSSTCTGIVGKMP
jgi:hypothetical protein